MSIKRQFRQWGYEISQAWGRVAFGGRIALGAIVSIGLALAVTRSVTAPLSKQIAALTKDLAIPENLDPEKDDEILMNREKETNLKTSLATWNERLASLKKGHASFDESLHATVIADVQRVFDRCGVLILSESLVPDTPPSAPASTRRRKRAASEEKPKPAQTAVPIGAFVHDYRVRGSFRSLQAALLLLERTPLAIRLHDLRLTADPGGDARLLTLAFKLDIRYLKKDAHGH
jgi:hypothetical protein